MPTSPDNDGDGLTDSASEAGVDACQGDSGGPLICNVNGRAVFQGIVTWGKKCGRKGAPGIYANVFHFVGWIEKQIENFPKEINLDSCTHRSIRVETSIKRKAYNGKYSFWKLIEGKAAYKKLFKNLNNFAFVKWISQEGDDGYVYSGYVIGKSIDRKEQFHFKTIKLASGSICPYQPNIK